MTVKTIGPRLGQNVVYNDAVYGNIAAIITSIDKTTGNVSLTTFPPNVAPATQNPIRYDYTGSTGTWHYHETDTI